jgi:PleD family two-component response regulator
MQRHQGAVTVGHGAKFTLYFPEVTGSRNSPSEGREGQRPGGQETILVVEDEDMILRLVVRLLTARGYDVLSAPSGHEALEILQRSNVNGDLLFVDVVMPGMRGPEFVRRARELDPSRACYSRRGTS